MLHRICQRTRLLQRIVQSALRVPICSFKCLPIIRFYRSPSSLSPYSGLRSSKDSSGASTNCPAGLRMNMSRVMGSVDGMWGIMTLVSKISNSCIDAKASMDLHDDFCNISEPCTRKIFILP